MNESFLSLTEAHQYTGKSRGSLRRFVESITKPADHPDRKFILPTIDEVMDLKKRNHPFSWRVNRELLDRQFPKEGTQASNSPGAATPLVRVLEKSISMLETELGEKNKQIAEFQERQRETNVLLKQANEKIQSLSAGSHGQH